MPNPLRQDHLIPVRNPHLGPRQPATIRSRGSPLQKPITKRADNPPQQHPTPQDTPRELDFLELSALGATRTPNLLIRSGLRASIHVDTSLLPGFLSDLVGCCRSLSRVLAAHLAAGVLWNGGPPPS